jgi:hypothetical protein
MNEEKIRKLIAETDMKELIDNPVILTKEFEKAGVKIFKKKKSREVSKR